MYLGASSPEELESLLEDAFVLGDRDALAKLFETDAVLLAADHALEARGAREIARVTSEMCDRCYTYLSDHIGNPTACGRRRRLHVMLSDRLMTDLTATYDRLARRWTHEQLADRYREAKRLGEQVPECDQDRLIRRPIAMLASAVPACASLSVAIHVIHVLPATGAEALRDQLLRNGENNSAVGLYRCHQALELDGQAHDYRADEWLPAVYDIAGPLLQAARLNREPPSLVEHAQEAVRWLSRAIVELDHEAPDAAAAIVDGLGRMLALHVFADVARTPTDELGT